MLETRGREVRVSNFENGTCRIRSGSNVSLIVDEFSKLSNETEFRISSNVIQRFLKPNDVVYFDDGKVVGIVNEVSTREVKMEIKLGGTIKSNSSVRFTGGKHGNLELVTNADIIDISTISKLVMIDYLAIPFCNSETDPLTVKEMLGPEGKQIKVVCKIDTLEGVQHYENILENSDGVAFVRNEIQWELASEKLMLAQKWCIQTANSLAKPIFIQSQLIESMITNDQPERAEMSEISTATLDGADSFIMSHETSCGKYPEESTNFLAKAIAEAENIYDYEQAFCNVRDEIKKQGHRALSIDVLTTAGCAIAYEQKENVDMFVCLTEDGKIARHLAKQRPKQPILACSTNGQVVR